MIFTLFRRLLSMSVLSAVLPIAQAAAVTETTDAGVNMASAFSLASGTTQVNGTINSGDYDLFRFVLDAPGTLVIGLGNSSMDDNLLLFDGIGRGLAGDDDSGTGFDSLISISLLAGVYFVGVGPNNMAGFTAAGVEFIDNDSGVLGSPTPEALGYIGNEFGGQHAENTGYILTFSVPTGGEVNEPATLALAGLALAGMGLLRRRKA